MLILILILTSCNNQHITFEGEFGNTTENITMGNGMATMKNDFIYLRNSYGIYEYDTSDNKVIKLKDGTYMNLNICGDKLFYNSYGGSEIYCSDLSGKNEREFYKAENNTFLDKILFYDNYIYMLQNMQLTRYNINTKELQIISDNQVLSYGILDNYLYYIIENDYNLYRRNLSNINDEPESIELNFMPVQLNVKNESNIFLSKVREQGSWDVFQLNWSSPNEIKKIEGVNTFFYLINNNDFYFINEDNNKFCKIDLNDPEKNITEISETNSDCINLLDGKYIYYSTYSDDYKERNEYIYNIQNEESIKILYE